MSAPTVPAPTARAQRADGIEARSRLLYAALALFAANGYAKTSTREIAKAAGANIAAISYYFGDKAGLYAATFTEPFGADPQVLITQFSAPGLPLEAALRIFMVGYLDGLKQGDIARQCMRLHLRELIDPTNEWRRAMANDVQAPHEAMAGVLSRHLQLKAPDDDIQRLTFSITGLAIQLFVMQDIVDALQPQLLASPKQIDTWADRLVEYGLALVASEAARRRKPARKEKK